MNTWNAIILGTVQGLTEFLPVSSSGHLVIIQHMIKNFRQPGILFDVVIHFGTVLSVIFYFRKELLVIIKKYSIPIVIGTIPAVIAGIVFSDLVEGFFQNIKYIGVALIITSFMNLVTQKAKESGKNLTATKSLFIGLFQAIALIPGISRSGSTIFAGTVSGIKKEEAAKFSFLLSVPAVIGANFYELIKYKEFLNGNFSNYFFGIIASLVFGVIAIKLVLGFIKKGEFTIFFWYCFVLGLLTLLL